MSYARLHHNDTTMTYFPKDLFHDKCNCFQGVGACIRRALRRGMTTSDSHVPNADLPSVGREELAAMTSRELVMDRGSPVMDFKVITGALKTSIFGDARPCSGLCMRSRMLGSSAVRYSALAAQCRVLTKVH